METLKITDMKKWMALCVLAMGPLVLAQGFLHTDGQRILDGGGNNVLLRGLGLGGWMVQEGYMLQTSAFSGPQHKIKEKIEQLIGTENTEAFYAAYLANGVTKRDIDSLKAWGFNSVRLPMHYNLYTPPLEAERPGQIKWLDQGFEMTDKLLAWCAANEMYLILDLHAAPGGQGHDANISDYDPTKPSLWESAANRKKMIALWGKIAERYKDSPWIGGYDIINEPNWNFEGGNANGCDERDNGPLRKLMVDITQVIRAVDPNHIIFIAGNCWGNNYNGIFPLWDDNTVISFHKYWNHNTQESIQQFLDYRETHNAPIWLGESGENSNVWFRESLRLMERNNIGWAYWPMKKVENTAGVTSVTKNPEYGTLLQYWEHGGERPDVEFARSALMQLAENYNMANVTVMPDVIDAMFRQVHSEGTRPYTRLVVPGMIPATHYDMGTQDEAYKDADFINLRVSTGERTPWNTGRKMRNDGVDIQLSSDNRGNGYEVFDIQDSEWLLFTVEVGESGTYDLGIRYSGGENGSAVHLEAQGKTLGGTLSLAPTGSASRYATATLSGVALKAGRQQVKLVFDRGGFNLNYLDFTKTE